MGIKSWLEGVSAQAVGTWVASSLGGGAVTGLIGYLGDAPPWAYGLYGIGGALIVLLFFNLLIVSNPHTGRGVSTSASLFFWRPALSITFTTAHDSNELMCEIKNSPLSKALRQIGLRRQAALAACSVTVTELRRNNHSSFYGNIDVGSGSPARWATIPPSETPAVVSILKIDRAHREINLPSPVCALREIGNYLVQVTVEHGGHPITKEAVLFVDSERLGAHWEPRLRSN